MIKKLIGFDESLLEKIEEFSKEENISFTEAVRKLVEIGLNRLNIPTRPKAQDEKLPDLDQDIATDDEIKILFERMEKLEKGISWWNIEETDSKVSKLEYNLGELDKKVNTLVEISKFFKSHINNRYIQ